MCKPEDLKAIVKLNTIGAGINGISKFTGMSAANIIKKMHFLSRTVVKPIVKEDQQYYEVDELYTFIKNKKNPCYVIYAINKNTKKVIDFTVGSRTKENISKVIGNLMVLNPKRVYTDRLSVYRSLIIKSIHSTVQYKTNHIERFNLTLRTHLKRLNRKTICYSKSIEMLESCLRIYLFKETIKL